MSTGSTGGAPDAGKLVRAAPDLGLAPGRPRTMLRESGGGGNPRSIPCSRCGCAGNYAGHGTYRRHVVHRGREERASIRRARCVGCGVTHALIPPGVVPYRSRSEAFVLEVLPSI